MEWRKIEALARSLAPEPEKSASQKQFWFNIGELATMLGRDRDAVSSFLREKSVPYICIGKSKSYFIGDVIDSLEKTRWADNDGRGKRNAVNKTSKNGKTA